MSTLKMQTRKKSLNISYTYSYRQIYPLIILILEFALIFIICFEHVTDYASVYRKKRLKQLKRKEKGTGMQTIDEALLAAYMKSEISAETAVSAASDAEVMKRKMRIY